MADAIKGMDAYLRRLAALGPGAERQRALGRLGLSAVREAKLLVPRKTGNLGRTIRLGKVSDRSVVVLAGGQHRVGYARDVEFGTRAHEIRPLRKKALRFAAGPGGRRLSGSPRTGAGVVFAKVVHHPGTRAQPYLVPGILAAVRKEGASELIVKPWNDAA